MRFDDFIHLTNSASEVEDLFCLFSKALDGVGFDAGYAYASLSQSSDRRFVAPLNGPVIRTTYSDQWCSHYVSENLHEIDPTVRHAISMDLPYEWQSVPTETAKSREFLEMAKHDAGLNSGMCIPIRGARGGLYLIGAASSSRDALAEDAMSKLYLFSTQFHAAFLKLATVGLLESDIPHLSPREKECLTWVARGKSNWDIGALLGVSERTVKDYLQTAFRKLGVHDRVQAVVYAIMKGLISP